jgi:hypothetical protein
MKRLFVAACTIVGAEALTTVAALPASASPRTPHPITAHVTHRHVTPDYEQNLSSTIQCATWLGNLSWAAWGSPEIRHSSSSTG